MGTGKYRRKRTHKAIKDISKKFRTKRRPKDKLLVLYIFHSILSFVYLSLSLHLDQIQEELIKKHLDDPMGVNTPETNEDLPGLGQFGCTECSRFFIDKNSLDEHTRSKVHKRRLKLLKDAPYTQAEAEWAAGMTR